MLVEELDLWQNTPKARNRHWFFKVNCTVVARFTDTVFEAFLELQRAY